MKYLLFLFFAILYEIDASCPNGTFPNVAGDKCYFIPNGAKQFILAELNCKQQNGDLASISNVFDNMDLTANAHDLLGSNVTFAWLGGNNLNNGTWVWTDEQPFSYIHWAKGNPDNNTSNNCLALNLSNGTWYSQNCYNIIPYICELSQTNCQTSTCPPCPQTTCPPCQSHCEISCPDSWVYNSTLGFCYKVFFNATYIPYNDSESICEQYNGHLASIHSDDENSFIWGLQYDTSPFIGLYYDLTHNAFQWSDNTPVNYTNFESNDTSIGYCVAQNLNSFDGSWYTTTCSYAEGFVCKTRPQIRQNNTVEYKIKDPVFIHITEGNNETKPINSYSEQDKCSNTCPTCVPDSCTPCPTICNTKCPDGWTYYSATNFCYQINQFSAPFTIAEQTCQQSNSHLISIHNENENNFLQQFVGNDASILIGLNYNVSLSNFTWTDNTPYDYSFWNSGQPNITYNQYCVFNLGYTSFPSFTWYTDICDFYQPFVCKKPPNF